MNNRNRVSYFWVSLIFLAFIGVLIFALLFFLPFDYQKNFIDSLAADGKVESYTPRIHNLSRLCSGPLALILIGLMVTMIVFFRSGASILQRIGSYIKGFLILIGREVKELLQAITPSKQELVPLIILSIITGVAFLLRYAYLWRPMGHDEAYTFVAFAARGLRYVISDYHLPNNHVFHTILVNLSYQLWGDSPHIVRLPAYLAGVMILPATYLVGRIFYRTDIALVSASIVASLPILIDYSTTARGYTLITFFTLVIIALAAFVKDHKNLIGWLFLVLFSSFGLYTNPIMVYPIGMVFTWLIISRIIGDAGEAYGWDFLEYFFVSFVLILILTGILYSPIIFNTGLQSLINNEVVEALSWSDFLQSVPARIRNTWVEWNRNLPGWVAIIALIGLVASFFVPRLPQNKRVPLLLAGVLWIGTALLVQRVAPWPRVWLFLLPLFIIWISAGLIGLIGLLLDRIPRGNYLILGLVSVFILLPLIAGFMRSYSQYSQKLHSQGEVERVAIYLQEILQPEDVVVVTSPDTIVLKYYLNRYGLSQEATELTKDKQFKHAIVVVNQAYGQSMDYVLERRSFSDDVSSDTAQEIYKTSRFVLYRLSGR